MIGYGLQACPTLYPGQVVRAELAASADNPGKATCGLYLRYYGAEDEYLHLAGPCVELAAGERRQLSWKIEEMDGAPLAAIGVEIRSPSPAAGTVYLDSLSWDGAPQVEFKRPQTSKQMWRRAWVNGVDSWGGWREAYHITQNEGVGLIMQGTRQWVDYQVEAAIKPFLMTSGGVAARVQGLRRYYALLLLHPGKAQLAKVLDEKTVLAEKDFAWEFDQSYTLRLKVTGDHLQGWIDDRLLFDLNDPGSPLSRGGIGLMVEEGSLAADAVLVR